MPALCPVQCVEASLDESLTPAHCSFSTVFSTNMLKTSARRMLSGTNEQKKAAPCGRLAKSKMTRLSRDFFQQLLVDVEVRVHVLHVVVLFERFHQADHRIGRRAFQLDVILRNR